MSDDTETFEPLTGPESNQLTLFAEGSPANRIRPLVEDWEAPTSATCGPKSSDAFAVLGPDGSWVKTSAGCCQMRLDGSLEAFSETWPRAGMTRNGTAYLRQPLAPLTGEIESGSWPTIRSTDGERGGRGDLIQAIRGNPNSHYKMWPTPTARDHKDGSAKSCANVPPNGLLGRVVHLWPTPTKSDATRSTFSSEEKRYKNGRGLQLADQAGGSLNPTWVEWLMGFPLGWTDCGDSATRSYQRSRNSSSSASRKRTPVSRRQSARRNDVDGG